ncbi:hypothetical protein SteCoe_37055 [Stentor coeruleus]|uniref:F-box domain-containing protein n=1 Tax=Stentor coeruleus TaxID=5963 RepID=A0A1R2ANS9_9CILI|nr:hypothetical protein SteCoe_37055 [Stentor coeruleus]
MLMNSFIIEDSPTGLTYCFVCGVKLEKFEMRVHIKKKMRKSEFYHLKCFKPRLPQYIREKDITINKLEDGHKKIFQEWINDWNSKYFPLDSQPTSNNAISTLMHDKSLSTTATRRRRILIEVFKFLDIYDLSKSLALVNKEYYHATWEPELWRCLIVRDFNEEASIDNNLRHKYFELFKTCCIECKKIPNRCNYYMCPLIKRILCLNCKNLDKYKLIGKTEIKTLYKICPKVLNIKFGISRKLVSVVYYGLFLELLKNFRQKNKKTVLDKLYEELDDNCKLVRDIKEIDTANMDKAFEKFGRIERIEPNWDCDNHDKDYKMLYNFIRSGHKKANFKKIFQSYKGENN